MGKFTDKQIKEIKTLRRNGWSVEYISWEYNTTKARVRNIINGNYEVNTKHNAR